MGLVDFQAVYKSDSGVSAIDYSAEFKDKFIASEELVGELIISSNVIDVNSQATSGGIKVVAVVEVTFDEIVSKDINVLTSANGDNVYQNTKTINYSTYIGRAYEKFDVTQDFKIDGAQNILIVTPCASLVNVEARDNYLILNGVLGLDICYKSGEALNDIATVYRSEEFSWEVALNGINASSLIQSDLSLMMNEIRVTSTPEDDGVSVNIYVPLTYSGYVFNQQEVEVVDDIYLEKNYLSITAENFETISSNESLAFSDNISGTASILETSPFIDEILGVCTNNIMLARSVVDDNKLIVEGVANATVVYYTKETNDLTSVLVEMPFAVEQKAIGENSSVVTLCLNNVSARSKRGKEIEVSAELKIYSDLYSLDNVSVISNIVVGEEKPKDDCSLYIYIVKPNQTLWDVAKEFGVSSEMILEQNPDIELPIKAGDKLVIYCPRIVNFDK